ncbi:MAG: type II secretion system F family protein [Mycobacteriaceae bacterium]|nr:type II secretion system F family protein [Mycobacteriaceae bacterium]
MNFAAVLLAAALWTAPGPLLARARAGLAGHARQLPPRPPVAADPLAIASSLDVLAVCLRAGMAVSNAAAATAPFAPPQLSRVLRRAADLLTLGADPAIAWSASPDQPVSSADPHSDALLRLARRSASSGAALADGVAELATQSRSDAAQCATAAAERATVLIAGPLGLCFLPAFVCLGIVPVVAGLAHTVLQSGLL